MVPALLTTKLFFVLSGTPAADAADIPSLRRVQQHGKTCELPSYALKVNDPQLNLIHVHLKPLLKLLRSYWHVQVHVTD